MRARELRAAGGSVKEIARALSVSTSSVSRWVRDVELTSVQRKLLDAHDRGRRVEVGRRNSERARRLREAWQAEGRARARARDPRHMAGCMLYWAEGSRSRNSVYFTNSDPAMIQFFLGFLLHDLRVERAAVRLDLNLFADHAADQRRIERYWLATLDLPPHCLRASTVNVYSRRSGRKRAGRLAFGTCRLSVHSTRIVQHIFGAIQEYGAFDRKAWLD